MLLARTEPIDRNFVSPQHEYGWRQDSRPKGLRENQIEEF